MTDLLVLQDIQLIPVLRLEPRQFSTKNRPSPSGSGAELPNEWKRYWLDSLADSGIKGFLPLHPYSWHVSTSEFDASPSLEKVLKTVFTRWGGIATLAKPEHARSLDGGFALRNVDGELLIEPNCCADLGSFSDWISTATYQGDEYQTLWIGHPWLSVRFADPWLILSEPHESEPPTGRWRIKPCDLEKAIAVTEQELVRFSRQIASVLASLALQGDPELFSRQLVGLD